MERKTFLATAAAGAAALGVVGGAPAQAKLDEGSDRNIRFMMKIINAVIDDLNQDSRDYGGYRATAVSKLQEAINNLNRALTYEETHSR